MLNNSNIITTIELESGLCITLSDETRHYFGGYYHVRILAHCDVKLDRTYFEDEARYLDALDKLGQSVVFERVMEKMAVPEQDIASVRNQLLDSFRNTSVAYMSSPDFERRFVRNEYRNILVKSVKKYAYRAF
ncbi:MAG: hypothetical protein RW306_12575 [Geobacteraceae bacterium]|nr:hypothetical protein [Geobacteraceae bacterium]